MIWTPAPAVLSRKVVEKWKTRGGDESDVRCIRNILELASREDYDEYDDYNKE